MENNQHHKESLKDVLRLKEEIEKLKHAKKNNKSIDDLITEAENKISEYDNNIITEAETIYDHHNQIIRNQICHYDESTDMFYAHIDNKIYSLETNEAHEPLVNEWFIETTIFPENLTSFLNNKFDISVESNFDLEENTLDMAKEASELSNTKKTL